MAVTMFLRGVAAAALAIGLGQGMALAGEAPGAPGDKSTWSPGDKSFLGTALSPASRVWFTGYRGILSEIAFGSVTQRQFNDMGFLIAGTDANGVAFVDEEKSQSFTVSRLSGTSLGWLVTTTPVNPGHGWKIEKRIVADPDSNALLINVTLIATGASDLSDYRFLFFTNPSISNSGGGAGQTDGNDTCKVYKPPFGPSVLVAGEASFSDAEKAIAHQRTPAAAAVAISGSRGWQPRKTGRDNEWVEIAACTYANAAGGYSDFLVDGVLNALPDSAANGNVMQFAQVRTGDLAGVKKTTFNIAVGFSDKILSGSTVDAGPAIAAAQAAVGKSFDAVRAKYDAQWTAYLQDSTTLLPFNDPQLNLAALSIKASEDRNTPGAIVAGLGIPWGDYQGDWVPGSEGSRTYGGYMLVWPRDMVQKAFGLMAAGDTKTPLDVLKYLFNTLMQTTNQAGPDGCFSDGKWCPGLKMMGRMPQNAWISGHEYWSGTQQDEVALPIVLAMMLHENGDAATKAEVATLWPKIKMAANYLVDSSDNDPSTIFDQAPYTHQERWEEVGGLSPSTMASQVAALVSAHRLSTLIEPGNAAQATYYLRKADMWRNHAATWMFTRSGPYNTGVGGVDGRHYMRISSSENANAGLGQNFKNGLADIDERVIVDAGFLEFVRLGVMSPRDWSILASLPETDLVLRQSFGTSANPSASVPAFFRYNGDNYGNSNDGAGQWGGNAGGRGRLWPIFTAERGLYEIAAAEAVNAAGNGGPSGQPHRDLLKDIGAAAFGTGFVPEQVWSKPVSGAHPGFTLNGTAWTTSNPAGTSALTPTTSSSPLNWAMGSLLQLSRAIQSGAVEVPDVVCLRYACNRNMAEITVTASFSANAPVSFGETVYLSGAPADGAAEGEGLIGNWQPPAGVPMRYENGQWVATLSLPRNTTFAFKFAKMPTQKPETGGFVSFQWESGANRTITVQNAASQSWSDPGNPVAFWQGAQQLN